MRSPAPTRAVTQRFALALVVAAAGAAASARAQPIRHEFIPKTGAPATASPPPQAVVTPASGMPEGQSTADGGGGDRPGAGAALSDSLRPDRDTSQPQTVSYSDPFTPRVTPFKRTRAYDSVDAGGELVVASPARGPVPSGAPRAGDETFVLLTELRLAPGEATPLPTPGPGARVLRMQTDPPARLRLMRDSADNWQVSSERPIKLTLALELAVAREAFGGNLELAGWPALRPALPSIPEPVRRQARSVARALSIPSGASPNQLLQQLVSHFRAFVPSSATATESGLALYRELALGGRGVCRHRAYAFTVTALGLGLPTRYVHNEAHAWVELFDGRRWRRLDLGGAAENLEEQADNRPAHMPPTDRFQWPEGSRSGQALARRAASGASDPAASERPNTAPPARLAETSPTGPATNGATPTTENAANGSAMGSAARPLAATQGGDQGQLNEVTSAGSPAAQAPASPGAALGRATRQPSAASPMAPAVVVEMSLSASSAQRGDLLRAQGVARRADRPCPRVSVDLWLEDPRQASTLLGSLTTDERGRFSGQVVVPYWASAGDYRVAAELTDGESCSRKPR